jgi:capsular exopolysaccharide synthesis family protein
MTDSVREIPNLISLLRRWWWLVIVGAALSLAASYVVTKHMKPVYLASSQLFVNTASGASVVGSYTDSQSALMLAASVADMLNSHRVAAEVLTASSARLSQDQLLSEMKASAAVDTPIVTIEVRDNSPTFAQQLANAAASAILTLYQGDQTRRYASLKETLQGQIAAATSQLAGATKLLSALDSRKPSDVAQISSLTIQINSLQSSLTTLNTQLNTVLLSQAQSDTTLTIIDHAQAPTSPESPSMPKNLLLALLLGVIGSSAIVAGVEYLDDSVRSPAFVEEQLKVPMLAIISRFKSKKLKLLLTERPWDTNAESFKTLRTNVQFMNVDQPPRSILIASGSPSEGKTTIAANYAVAVAQAGRRVILVDCDMRRPSQDRMFGLGAGPGLTDYLSDDKLGLAVARITEVGNLRVVTCGPIPPNPSELLGSHRMASFLELAKSDADLVVLDSSPALVVTDASVLARQVDGVLLVVDQQSSRMRPTLRTLQLFTLVGGKVLGVVVNKFDTHHGGYGGYGYGEHYHGDKTAKASRGTGMGASSG